MSAIHVALGAQKQALRSMITSKLSAIPPQIIQEQSIIHILFFMLSLYRQWRWSCWSQQTPSSGDSVLCLSFSKRNPWAVILACHLEKLTRLLLYSKSLNQVRVTIRSWSHCQSSLVKARLSLCQRSWTNMDEWIVWKYTTRTTLCHFLMAYGESKNQVQFGRASPAWEVI